MKKTILILFLCARVARGETTLSFAAQVEDESLAEDAIQLVHCLSERSGHGWEFTGEAHGPLRLSVREEAHALKGVYHKDGRDIPFSARAGESEAACEGLEPQPAKVAQIAPDPLGLGKVADVEEPIAESGSKAWIWAAVGVAVIGGLVLWRARQPSYRAVEMR